MLRFRLFGIPFQVGSAFWIGSAVLGSNNAQGTDALPNLLLWIACVFVSITVHELGHALTARRFGASPTVELLALGGVTRMFGRELTRPESFWVTLAGPAAGFGLYLVALGAGVLASGSALGAGAVWTWKALWFLRWINLVWTLFNLLPILPLDGGRLLSALLGPGRIGIAQGVGVFFAGSLAVLAALNRDWFVALFLGYLAFVNFQGTSRTLPDGIGR